MKKVILLAILLFVIPLRADNQSPSLNLKSALSLPEAKQEAPAQPLQALTSYKETLQSRGQKLDDQGVLIQTLDGSGTVAEHNADIAFNPASVMKIGTSLVALAKFGPDYRYRTNFLADGQVDTSARKLEGDLVVEGNCDPVFSADDAQEVASRLSQLGVSRVTGALRIAGPFYYFATGYHVNLSRETSAAKLRAALTRAGIKIDGQTTFGEKSGTVLVTHYSDELARILLYQNAHSSNAIAEVVGESVGGPKAVQDFLVDNLGLHDSDLYVGRTSGLDFNRITPRAALQVLRGLITLLDKYSMKPQDVMAVAGIDSGTLRARLGRDDVRGAVIAKTGTLVSFDSGVSTLVGIAYTKAHGPLLFAVFNSAGNVNAYRRLQDEFVEKMIAEEGGAVPVGRSEDALADSARHSIVQVVYKPGSQPAQPSEASSE